MPKLFGLIGHPLTHSFSKKYFEDKFSKEKLDNCRYELFDLKNISHIEKILMNNSDLVGLNVTIPYKESVIKYVDFLDSSAEKVGAVNVIKVRENGLSGYNSDFYGFHKSLINWLHGKSIDSALIFGAGGASKAVCAALKEMEISYQIVSRSESKGDFLYDDLKKSGLIKDSQLLINTTPVGTFPKIDEAIPIPYNEITSDHFVYDLIYNPSISKFLSYASDRGAEIKNGLEMLELQAEKSWEIWNS